MNNIDYFFGRLDVLISGRSTEGAQLVLANLRDEVSAHLAEKSERLSYWESRARAAEGELELVDSSTLMADNRRHMQRIEALERQNGDLLKQVTGFATVPEDWREAVQEFVDRVEAGQIKSKHTYGKFKALLSPDPKSGDD